MSFAHDIDNDNSLFDFDSNEPLSLLEESTREQRTPSIFTAYHSSTGQSNRLSQRDRRPMDGEVHSAETKGKRTAVAGATEPLLIPTPGNIETEIDVFALSFQSAGSSSSSQPNYDHLAAFDFQAAQAITYLDPDGIMEVPVSGEGDEHDTSKGKARELPPTLPPLSFSPGSFSYDSVDWPSVAGPSSYGSSVGGVELSPTSPSPSADMTLNTPVSSTMSSPISPEIPRRRTVSNASRSSRRSLSVPSIPRMKAKFTQNKGALARKLLFRKSPTTSPRPSPVEFLGSNDSQILSDLGYITERNCLVPWSRSPPATPVVETSPVSGVVDSQLMSIRATSALPLRTKGRSYSSPLPLPQRSVLDVVPLGPVDIFEPLPPVFPAYFDDYLPRELKLHVFAALLDIHEADFEKRVEGGKWTAVKASASRNRWTGRDKGLRELFKFSRVSRSWRDIVFDGQLWSELDLSSFPKVPASVLAYMLQSSGGFVRHLNLTGHATLSASALIELSSSLSVHGVIANDPGSTIPNHLTSLNLQGCSSLSTRSLHHILIRSPQLHRLNLRGHFAVTNVTCDIIFGFCPKLVSLDLSRCSNMTGEGIRSAASRAVGRGEHIVLKQLRLSGLRQVSDEMMLMLGKAAPYLEVLDLSYAKDLHNSAIEAFVACTEDDADQIDAVQLTAREAGRDQTDTGRYWRRVTRLRHLNFSACILLTDHACSHLAHAMPKLELLELAGIGPELNDDGLVRLLETTPLIRKLDLEDATAVSDDVLVALTPSNTTLPPSRVPRNAPPEPGHALEHLIISYANVESEALSELIRACPRLRVLEADNTRLNGVTLREFVQTVRRRKMTDAKIVAIDCRSVGEIAVKELTAHSRPRMGWRSWHARKLGYLDDRDDEGLGVGQDECDPSRVIVKSFYSWQTVDSVQAAREKKRKTGLRRHGNTTGSSIHSDDAEGSSGRARWWSSSVRRSVGPSTPTMLDLNTDRSEGCTIM